MKTQSDKKLSRKFDKLTEKMRKSCWPGGASGAAFWNSGNCGNC